MKTTIDIPEELLAETIRISGAKTKREAVIRALEEYKRRDLIDRLVASFGTWDIASNEEIEAADVEEANRLVESRNSSK